MPGASEAEAVIAAKARRRISRRLLPFLFILYVIAYLDRVNVGYAALEMTRELNFSPAVFGFGAGIFFLGYFLLEIPGTLLVESWSARRWIARIMVTWGVLAIATGFVHTPHQFYWVRFLLGLSEAGFFPGMVVYLSHWFRREERAQAMAWFMAAQPISNIVGAPISGWLLGIHWLGWPGWRWLFVMEGLPAVVLGVVTIWYLTDWPHQAHWLPEDERLWLEQALERERQALQKESPMHFWQAFRRREVILLTFGCFGMASSIYAFNFFLPTLLKRMSGLPNFTIAVIAMLPYCVGLVAVILVGWSADRTGKHKAHTAACMGLIALGLVLSYFQHSVAMTLAAFCLAAIGMYGYLPAFWSLPADYLTGTAAAASVGLINSVGNLGGFFGPSMVGYLTQTTHSFGAGVLLMAGLAAMSATMVLLLPKTKRVSSHSAPGGANPQTVLTESGLAEGSRER